MANEVARAFAPLAGMAVGAGIAAGTGGMGAGMGALVGGAVGQSLSSGMGILEKVPELPGPSGAQLQALGVQTRLMAQMSEMRGMAQQDVQNLTEFARASTMNNFAAMNALPTQMNNIDRVNLARAVRSQIESAGIDIDQMIAKYDPGAEFKRMGATSQVAGQVSATGSDVARQEREVKTFRLAQEQQKMQMFAQALQGLTQAAVMASADAKANDAAETDDDTWKAEEAQADKVIAAQKKRARAKFGTAAERKEADRLGADMKGMSDREFMDKHYGPESDAQIGDRAAVKRRDVAVDDFLEEKLTDEGLDEFMNVYF